MYINNDLFHSLVDLVSFKFLRFFEVKAKIHHHKNLNQKPKIKNTVSDYVADIINYQAATDWPGLHHQLPRSH